jgi:predicted AlkP superfamily phosphohydrolase/phosphomutase
VRVMILGLDGATWDLLLPMIEQGKMRNLQRAMDMGSWGVLESTLPPLSPVAWTSLVTGKNPGKHGVLDFVRMQDGRQVPVDSRSIRAATLWHILSSQGRRVGVVNVPMTYPPEPVNGYMLSGMMTPVDAEDYAYPPGIEERVRASGATYVADPYVKEGRSEHFLREILHWADQKEAVCRFLLGEHDWDFFMNVIRGPDLVQHYFYNALDPGHPRYDRRVSRTFGPLLDRVYDVCDQAIGHRLGMLEDDGLLLIVSDHGFGPASTWFETSRFLIDIGLLTLQTGRGLRAAIAGRVDLSLLARLDFLDLRHRLTTSSRVAAGQMLDTLFSAPSIDWSRTKAYCCTSDGKGIRINRQGREPHGIVESEEELAEIRNHLLRELRQLRDPNTGKLVVSDVHFHEELYSGPYAEEAPDLVFSLERGPYVARRPRSARRVFQRISSKDWTGVHRRDGIILAVGRGVREGRELSRCSIVDVAPTVLAAMGLAIPDDMDGVPVQEAFEGRLAAPDRSNTPQVPDSVSPTVSSAYSEREEQEILERLRHLGYLE